MLCYKDRTFCVSPNCKNECGRKLTPEIREAANRWWMASGGKYGEAQIAMSYFCEEPKKAEEVK